MTVKQLTLELNQYPESYEVKISVLGKQADITDIDYLWDGLKGTVELHDFPKD